ncbi:glycine/betaine/sarcosine/D-proline family reductase selenoprotein B [Salibacterium salarium]|uniref:Glycine/betaine/sarcosine/D-proline family reductase selenoprotein B n=2 Tax=Salibacterium salarium TaxID=284579 RepID=A0A3R9P3A1_9BACI|nr:glycine/betaine/sarcosine/D-proline family reductase selenoprotein B [Salibacterium salarium]
MVKEIERAGIPVAQICTMLNVAQEIGANRIIPSSSILYPTGDPNISSHKEKDLRRQLMQNALTAVRSEIHESTIFELNHQG